MSVTFCLNLHELHELGLVGAGDVDASRLGCPVAETLDAERHFLRGERCRRAQHAYAPEEAVVHLALEDVAVAEPLVVLLLGVFERVARLRGEVAEGGVQVTVLPRRARRAALTQLRHGLGIAKQLGCTGLELGAVQRVGEVVLQKLKFKN